MELELRKLEDLAESIVQDFAYMRAREEEMRDTNGEFAIPFPPAPGDHSIPPLTQSPPTPEYYTSAFSPCAVCCAWLPGRCSTCEGSFKRRNSLNSLYRLSAWIIEF